LVSHLLSAQKLLPADIADRATNMLNFVQKLARRNPEIVYGDGRERTEQLSSEEKTWAMQVAAEGIVLLKNDESVLPIKKGSVKKLLVVGPNAKGTVVSGGGAASLKPSYHISPWQGILDRTPEGTEVTFSIGCYGESCASFFYSSADTDVLAHKYLPTIGPLLTVPDDPNTRGWVCTFHAHDSNDEPLDKILAPGHTNPAQ
jgi:beta-glucosidase